MLFSEKEAELVALLPIKPFTAAQAARCWKLDLLSARKVLDELAGRAILLDCEQNDEMVYTLPPPMAGFFEFSMMRLRTDVDQKVLSELFYQYLNVEEDFIRGLFLGGETRPGRVFVQEPVLSNENSLHVLDYERATQVIETATAIGVGICYCRHKMEHLGRDCDAPKEICMTFNTCADSLIRADYAKQVDKVQCKELLQSAYKHGLVQFGENAREGVSFICNCCGCCCEALIAQRKFGFLNPIHTTNFLPVITEELCSGCTKCVTACPVEAMGMVSTNNPHRPNQKKARVEEDLCLGCGVCVRACSTRCITLKSRPEHIITPMNSVHRVVMMAIERGRLQDLIFDNRVLWNHRAMAAVLGVILKLPPVKQIMASNQVKSRYLETLIRKLM